MVEFENCRRELEELYRQEEIMWRQRSKALWLKEGDKNTKYFHAVASMRKQRKGIVGIKNEAGLWFSDPLQMEAEFTRYFRNIFTSDTHTMTSIEKVVECLDNRITEDMRLVMDAAYTPEDIKQAAFQMQGDKAPGLDGMTPLFFQKCWHIVGQDVISLALAFLNEGQSLPDINHTNIVLIPKVSSPESPKDFRPISLCNVVFKIISKALANRLNMFLSDIIGDNQSAFVPERMIFDNAMIAFETIHHMSNKRGGRKAYMTLKLDLSKAYDRVEWDFLKLACIKWVSLINGFHRGDIKGVSVSRSAPCVSHLFFADDSILFLRAKESECKNIVNILKDFGIASGQQVNIDKSSIFFSANTPVRLQADIMNSLGVHKILDKDKYLGLPIMIGRSKVREFRYIKDRLIQCVQRWSSKLFFIAGKAVMIQSVAQAIPVYLMSIFRFPKSFIQELNGVIAKFWWGDTDNRRLIHWKSWESLCVSKADGGLGFRDFEAFNLSLLAKQCWRLVQNPNPLCFRILRAKYFPSGLFLSATLGSNPSFLWRNNPPSYAPRPRDGIVKMPMKVAELMDFDSRSWREEKLLELFCIDDVFKIMCLPIPRVSARDSLVWNVTDLGDFSVRSAYYVACKILRNEESQIENRDSVWKLIWNANVLPKMKFFIWRVVLNILPLKTALIRRGLDIDDFCNTCGGREVSAFHVFFECPLSKRVWELSAPWVEPCISDWDGECEFWSYFLSKAARVGCLDKVMCFMWLLWQNRNSCVYDQTCHMPGALTAAGEHMLRQTHGLSPSSQIQFGSGSRRLARLHPPPHGMVKINVDAYFSEQEGVAGLGVVIRGFNGDVMVSASRELLFVSSPLYAEVHALLFAFELALEWDVTNCVIESDCLIAIKEIKSSKPCWWDGGNLIYEIRDLALLFDECVFAHVNREANVLAHRLAALRVNCVWSGCLAPGVCNPNSSHQ
ncbi:reverse transcriptase [Corchorus capsularis]|uniref:Reverse transcriptase n=1 Tax=Corchorus capsularis TaxID=210143 RepID=A0A1R3J9H7_COCAP|nr:reverse transcriptase [Corchorus capsularis]